MTMREMVEEQAAARPDNVALRHVLDGPYDIRATPWADHGVFDEEGVPTEFEAPAVTITVAAIGRASGDCVKAYTFPASEVPILAEAIEGRIDEVIAEQVRNVNEEVARFTGVVDNLRTQCSRLQSLRRPPCNEASAC